MIGLWSYIYVEQINKTKSVTKSNKSTYSELYVMKCHLQQWTKLGKIETVCQYNCSLQLSNMVPVDSIEKYTIILWLEGGVLSL